MSAPMDTKTLAYSVVSNIMKAVAQNMVTDDLISIFGWRKIHEVVVAEMKRIEALEQALRDAPRPNTGAVDVISYIDWYFKERCTALRAADGT